MRVERGVIRKTLQERVAVRKKLRLEQNLTAGIIAGAIAGIIGAVAWCVITVTIHVQFGFMAIAVGAMAGLAIRYGGKGVDPVFGICGAAIAVISCIFGNYLSEVGFVADATDEGFAECLRTLDPVVVLNLMKEKFSLIDVLFYGFAAFEGYKFSLKNIDAENSGM